MSEYGTDQLNKMVETVSNAVKEIVKKLVDKPEGVVIETSTSTKNVILQLKVDKNDFGKVIGKKGRTIESLKVIGSAIKKTNFPDDSRNVIVEILED